jgi:gluconolactonase
MRTTAIVVLTASAVALTLPALGNPQPAQTEMGKVVRLDPRLDKLIAKDAKVYKIAGGFIWSEGPVWVKDGGYLLFSDIPRNVINKYNPKDGSVSVFLKPSGYTGKPERGGKAGDEPGSNGLMLDPQGRLVICEHGDRQVSRIEKDGKKTVLADKYMGKRLNSPNDLVYKSNGDLYFTDPPYGLLKNWDDPARELDFCGIYRLSKDGKLVLLTKDCTRPNGLTFSLDEKHLYVANSDPKLPYIYSFDVLDDGTLGKKAIHFDTTKWVEMKMKGLPDGMKLDASGNLFATGPGGVWILAADGTPLGRIDTGVATANCAFGEDGSVLYMAADHDLCKIQTTTKGKGF